jgi:aryl-alcohol dehydrogenase-like predicted oxidoreductase
LHYRTLGRTGWQISTIGYGAWGIGGKQWLGGSDDESVRALRRAIDLGLNFIDTALAYGDGHSERLVGQVVRDTPKKIYVATKVPPKNRIWPAQKGVPISEVFPYEYIIECARESHRNLDLPFIDLLQLHVWNPEWLKDDDWRRAFDDLKASGKVAAVGVSINDHQPDSALDLIRTGLIDTVQVIYNVFDQTPERNLFPLCQTENIGVIARVPLDEGALTGNITPATKFPPGDFREFYFKGDRKQQVVEHVEAIRRDLPPDANLADTALRFCLSHPAVTTVIPGMRSVHHAESNVGLSDQGPLPADTLAKLKNHAWDRNFYS